jgi:hypothetical protein
MSKITANINENEKFFHRAIAKRRGEKSISSYVKKAVRLYGSFPDDFLVAMRTAARSLEIPVADLIVLLVQSQTAQASAFQKVFGIPGQGITRALKYHRAEDEINMDTLSVKLQNDYAKAYQNLKDKIVTARTTGKDIYMTHQEAEILMPEIRAGT